jgi:hypothetical protein
VAPTQFGEQALGFYRGLLAWISDHVGRGTGRGADGR